MKEMLKVYLAGPMTNCSERQKAVWRKRVKDALRTEFKCIDPTDPRANKGALAVSADIEGADVVIANMWRESIGTTIGIVQAKRMGIPVVLIDPNYLDSAILQSIVGDFLVHSEEAAINKLRNEIAPGLTRKLSVIKRNGTEVPFDIKKLQKSLKSACLKADVDDSILHILLSRRVHRAILATPDVQPIRTDTIRKLILEELQGLSHGSLGQGDPKQIEHGNALRYAWEFYDLVKEHARDERSKDEEHLAQIEELSGQNRELQCEVENLRAQLGAWIRPSRDGRDSAGAQMQHGIAEEVRKHLGNKRALCISNVGKTRFASAFERRGICQEDFADLFEEMILEGKQSNLNADLNRYVAAHPFVLYAFEGLRHINDSLRKSENLIVGAGANDVVRKFVARISPERING